MWWFLVMILALSRLYIHTRPLASLSHYIFLDSLGSITYWLHTTLLLFAPTCTYLTCRYHGAVCNLLEVSLLNTYHQTRPGIEPTTFWSQVQLPIHSATEVVSYSSPIRPFLKSSPKYSNIKSREESDLVLQSVKFGDDRS